MTARAAASDTSLDYARDLLRAVGGALLFALPLLMTMEMWALGFAMGRERLILFLVLGLGLLVGLSHFAGFRHTTCLRDDIFDGLSAFAVGFLVAGALLFLFGVLHPDQPLDELVGKVALQAVPAGLGAVLARKQFAGSGDPSPDDASPTESYPAELFTMVAGALFIALNVAPTEEMRLIAYQMNPVQTIALAFVSIGLLHALVYALGFAGQHSHERPWIAFLHFTLPGYALTLLVCLYVQWTFGHLDGHGLIAAIKTTLVIGLPGAIGAGAARLVI